MKTRSGHTLDSLLWMDDACTVHYDTEKLQEVLSVINHVAKKYHVVFGIKKV